MSCGVGHRCSSDATLLWLWCRPAATALIRRLAWELPYAVGAALEKTKKKKKSKLNSGIARASERQRMKALAKESRKTNQLKKKKKNFLPHSYSLIIFLKVRYNNF